MIRHLDELVSDRPTAGESAIAMCYVPPGKAVIGSTPADLDWLLATYRGLDAAWFGREPTARRVQLDGFWIATHPITNGQFAEFVRGGGYARREYWSDEGVRWLSATGRSQPKFWSAPRWSQWSETDRPVIGVSWYESQAYARWAGARVPTEVEWEYAARGCDGRRFPWGDTFELGLANTADAWLGRIIHDVPDWVQQVDARRLWRRQCLTTPVGAYPLGASPWGLLDMAGNVWEWCADSDPGTAERALRGGSFGYMSWSCRAAERAMHPPWWCSLGVGFRVCCSAPNVRTRGAGHPATGGGVQ